MNGQTTGTLCAPATPRARWGGSRCREIVLWRRGKGAFTLIELLVVISIISLLVAILTPSIQRAMELARRAACASNLRGIAVGLVLYEQIEGSYPYIPLNGAGWGVRIGAARDTSPYEGQAQGRNASSNLYLLARTAICPPKMFLCPSAREKGDSDRAAEHWDFQDGTRVSYALMNPYGPTNYFRPAEGSVVVLADGSPYFDPKTGLRNSRPPVNFGDDPGPDDISNGNSPNHSGQGQNVVVSGASTTWQRRADCGLSRDNIYTRAQADDKTDPGGNVPASGANGCAEGQGPAGPDDSYLIP